MFTVGGGRTLKFRSMVRVSNGFRFSKSNVSVLLFWEVVGSLEVRKLSFVSLNSRGDGSVELVGGVEAGASVTYRK
jgi:hypothetical protein